MVGQGSQLAGANLSGDDLAGDNLQGVDLAGADLAGDDLAGANLTGANLTDTNLSKANLSGALVNNADLDRANVTGANLAGADFGGANFTDASFSGTGGDSNTDVTAVQCPIQKVFDIPGKTARGFVAERAVLFERFHHDPIQITPDGDEFLRPAWRWRATVVRSASCIVLRRVEGLVVQFRGLPGASRPTRPSWSPGSKGVRPAPLPRCR